MHRETADSGGSGGLEGQVAADTYSGGQRGEGRAGVVLRMRLTKAQKRHLRVQRNDCTWGDFLGHDGRKRVREMVR